MLKGRFTRTKSTNAAVVAIATILRLCLLPSYNLLPCVRIWGKVKRVWHETLYAETCVTILEAVCAWKPSPQHRLLVTLGFGLLPIMYLIDCRYGGFFSASTVMITGRRR